MIKFKLEKDKTILKIEDDSMEVLGNYLEVSIRRKYSKRDMDLELIMQLEPNEIRGLVYALNSWLIEREYVK